MELSATELRIGNLVGIASSLNFSTGKVTLTSNNRILLDNKISNKNHKFIPIELTEEWLLKFGFEKLTDNVGNYSFNHLTANKFFVVVHHPLNTYNAVIADLVVPK